MLPPAVVRWGRVTVLAGVLAIAACATEQMRAELVIGGGDAAAKLQLWPAPPDVPRYMYAGELTGEANFRRPEQDNGGFGGLLRWIAGIVAGDAAPVVLQRPQHGVVDDRGRIYVTDASRQAVFVFDQQAGELLVWDKADGLRGFVAPAGIALGSNGEVLVTDAELGLVARLDRTGNPVGQIGKGLLKRPTGIARDPQRRLIYVADTYAHDVKVFDDEGRLVNLIGRRGEAPGEFNYPVYLAFARGELYVTDTMNSRVQVFSADGDVLQRQFGSRGLYVGNLVRPKGVAVDHEGNVYVMESYYDHLLVFDRLGRFLMAIGGTGTGIGKFFLPAGVWTDRRGRIFIADMFNGRVVVFQFLGGGVDGEA